MAIFALKFVYMFRITFVVVLVSVCLIGCGEKEEACVFVPEPASTVDLKLQHLHETLVNINSKGELIRLFTTYPLIRDEIFRRAEYPNDSLFLREVYGRLTNPHLDTLLSEVNRVFGDLSSLEQEFEQAFTNLKYYYPDFIPPKIQTVISGLDTDLYVSDSLIIVGLDFYLGRGAKYRPKMYEYILRRYDTNDIVPSCLLIFGISNRFNKTEVADKTALADMIAYGKSFYFAKHMLPCVPDSVFLWYTPTEMNGSRENEDLIWKRFVESQVLFSTNHKTKQDYLGDRPITIQVGEKCPGRIGQWIGWQIVKSYGDSHPETPLPKLMSASNAQKIFKESAYKPLTR
jgi:hypothetical protein